MVARLAGGAQKIGNLHICRFEEGSAFGVSGWVVVVGWCRNRRRKPPKTAAQRAAEDGKVIFGRAKGCPGCARTIRVHTLHVQGTRPNLGSFEWEYASGKPMKPIII